MTLDESTHGLDERVSASIVGCKMTFVTGCTWLAYTYSLNLDVLE